MVILMGEQDIYPLGVIKFKFFKSESKWKGEANADIKYDKDERRSFSWVPTSNRGKGWHRSVRAKIIDIVFCDVKCHVFFAVCNTWFFREFKQSPYPTNLSTSPITYLRTNAMHYILVPM